MEIKGKIAAFLGDSITEGTTFKDPCDRERYRYDNVLKRECLLAKTYNHGLGGTRIAHQTVPTVICPKNDLNFCGRAHFIEDDADLIVVFGGINDYLFGDAPFGNIGDTTHDTFCGAVYFLMDFLRTRHPEATVVFMTPTHTSYRGYDELLPSPSPRKKPCARPLVDYVEAIKDIARLFDVPVLDLYHDFEINPSLESDRLEYAPDGLHLNAKGHAKLAKRLREFLEML
jgi:lysophospholipase L1-like esterase